MSNSGNRVIRLTEDIEISMCAEKVLKFYNSPYHGPHNVPDRFVAELLVIGAIELNHNSDSIVQQYLVTKRGYNILKQLEGTFI